MALSVVDQEDNRDPPAPANQLRNAPVLLKYSRLSNFRKDIDYP
jgi:hypothetical protein